MISKGKINLRIYPIDVYFFILNTPNDFHVIEHILKFKYDELSPNGSKFRQDVINAKGYSVKPNKNTVVITIHCFNIRNKAEFEKCIRHESQNAANYTFDYIDASDQAYQDMPYIYLNDYIFQRIIESVESPL